FFVLLAKFLPGAGIQLREILFRVGAPAHDDGEGLRRARARRESEKCCGKNDPGPMHGRKLCPRAGRTSPFGRAPRRLGDINHTGLRVPSKTPAARSRFSLAPMRKPATMEDR